MPTQLPLHFFENPQRLPHTEHGTNQAKPSSRPALLKNIASTPLRPCPQTERNSRRRTWTTTPTILVYGLSRQTCSTSTSLNKQQSPDARNTTNPRSSTSVRQCRELRENRGPPVYCQFVQRSNHVTIRLVNQRSTRVGSPRH